MARHLLVDDKGMKLKTKIEHLDEVDEQYRGLYEEVDDGYVLAVEGVEEHPAIKELKNAYERNKVRLKDSSKDKEKVKRLSRLLEADPELDVSDLEDETLENAIKLLKGEQLTEPEGKGKPPPVDLDKVKANAVKPFQRENEQLKSERDEWKDLAERTLIESSLNRELETAGVKDPDFRKLLVREFKQSSRLEKDEDTGQYQVLTDGEYGELPPAKVIKEWSGTEYAKKFIEAPANFGGGINGNRSGSQKPKNPWTKGQENFSEQMRIGREDPELAKRMMEAAGKQVRGF